MLGMRARRPVGLIVAVVAAVAGSTLFVAPSANAAPPKPTMSLSTSEAMVNERVVVSGKVRKAKKGTKVMIQQKSGTSWSTIAKTRVKAKKVYKKRVRFGSPGVKVLRVKVAKRKPSAAKHLKVYRWQPLLADDRIAQFDGGQADPFYDRDAQFTNGSYSSRTVQGRSYHNSPSGWGDTGWSDWSLRRQCVEFRALVGLDDDSVFGISERVSVLGDGLRLFLRDFTNDQSNRIALNVRGVQRLRLQHEILPVTPNVVGPAYVNFGNAQVKCLY